MTRIWTNIEPIDTLFSSVNETGIPLPSVVALVQEDFDDATRYILFNLIDNFYRKDYICIYIVLNNKSNINEYKHAKESERIIEEWDNHHLKKRKKLLTFVDILPYASEEKKAFIEIMDAVEAVSLRDNTKDFKTKEFKNFGDCDENKLYFIEENNISELINKYKGLLFKHPNDRKIVIFENSSWILDNFEKSSTKIDPNIPKESKENKKTESNSTIESFFELCKPVDKNTIIFHFFTLSMHDDKTKAKIGDSVDGYIHLKSITKNIYRPFRSVSIRKMREVRGSTEFNAYRFDDYGVVKEFGKKYYKEIT